MKKVAVLLDGGLLLRRLYRILGSRHPTAEDVWQYANACVRPQDEELFRIYFYDCPPFEKPKVKPLSGEKIDFAATATSRRRRALHEKLALMDYVAIRRGELSFNGWVLSRETTENLIETKRALIADDLQPDFEQKRVDMKIGLDVAWLASKRIVDRIVLVTTDSDFVPAMKFARREGVQVVLVTMGETRVKQELKEHADEVRNVSFNAQPLPLQT